VTITEQPPGWGWVTTSYVIPSYKRPFYNKAKELLFSDKRSHQRHDQQLRSELS